MVDRIAGSDTSAMKGITEATANVSRTPRTKSAVTIAASARRSVAVDISHIRRAARKVTSTSDVWNGVTAAQVTSSFDAEAEEVSDDAPTVTGPSIPIHMMRTFVPYTIEVIVN